MQPAIFPALRVLADRPRAPARFLLLGSASFDLIRRGSETLAGRVTFHDLPGLGLDEVGTDRLDRLWLRGGFPRSFLGKTRGGERSLEAGLHSHVRRARPSPTRSLIPIRRHGPFLGDDGPSSWPALERIRDRLGLRSRPHDGAAIPRRAREDPRRPPVASLVREHRQAASEGAQGVHCRHGDSSRPSGHQPNLRSRSAPEGRRELGRLHARRGRSTPRSPSGRVLLLGHTRRRRARSARGTR